MSNYVRRTKNPITGTFEDAMWIDDHFGRHRYGVSFSDGKIYRQSDYQWEFQDKPKMANVYESEPDSRQSADPALKVSRFRPRYRALSDGEKALHDELKSHYAMVEQLIDQLPKGRYQSLAMTALEESCMWGIKSLTDSK